MKINIHIDPSRDEEVIVYAHKRNRVVDEIERLVEENDIELVGYIEREATLLKLSEIYCFRVVDGKVYAQTISHEYLLKARLYQLEEILPDNFIKINQSCIANIKLIERFSADFSGTLRVIFKNGETDYVSRRSLKNVKERLGL